MTNSKSLPKWATLDRKDKLVQLFVDSGGFCVYGLKPCQGYATETEKTACAWGKFCFKPMPDGQLCRYRPEPDKPHLPCHYVTIKIIRWRCAYGDYPCYKRFGSHYEMFADTLIADWKQQDREQSNAELEAERKAIHSLGERSYPVRGQFSAISKGIFAESQPLYYFEGQAVSGLTFTPFIRVRIASSYIRLYVDLGEALRQVSKSKRRKAIRYGKALPETVIVAVRRKVLEAVKDYYTH